MGEKELTQERPATWGCSSAGRAPALQAGGRQFDSVHLHHQPAKVGREAEGKDLDVCHRYGLIAQVVRARA